MTEERLSLETAMEGVQLAEKLSNYLMNVVRKEENLKGIFSTVDLSISLRKADREMVYQIFSQKIKDEMETQTELPQEYLQTLYDSCIKRLKKIPEEPAEEEKEELEETVEDKGEQ